MGRGASTGATQVSHVPTGLGGRPAVLAKYWTQRYRLFHQFDNGIRLNAEGWFSVTPHKIAAHHARRFAQFQTVADCFSGFGSNAIHFERAGCAVVAVELVQEHLDMAIHNSSLYGCDQKQIRWVCQDVYEFLDKIKTDRERGNETSKIDAMFMSPPWGGPEYIHEVSYDLTRFKTLVDQARAIIHNVAILVPKNIDIEQVFQLFGPCEVESNFLAGKLKTKTIYFGDLVNTQRVSDDDSTLPEIIHFP